jgi:hypothetical protein
MPSASIKLAGTGCDLRCFPHSSFAFSADSVCASLFSKPLLHFNLPEPSIFWSSISGLGSKRK